ncbi:MAG: hypothetical protein Greene07147_474 [Parcubacteria group bacterium Greene0714_7]|nr:MAG: hypothetical protein Greene07147_474 [Parcubacteria group bacterium Greene0714_7]
MRGELRLPTQAFGRNELCAASETLPALRFRERTHEACDTLLFLHAERGHSLPHFARLAQLVEQLIYTEKVGGSSPSPRTRSKLLAIMRTMGFIKTL